MAKREHPTFDINPRIALEYLSRIQKGKEGESSFKDRPLYQEEEAQKFLEFQAPLEEYTPWKDMPMEREKEEVPDDHPITWADAARKKQNSINGNGDKAHGSRGMTELRNEGSLFASFAEIRDRPCQAKTCFKDA